MKINAISFPIILTCYWYLVMMTSGTMGSPYIPAFLKMIFPDPDIYHPFSYLTPWTTAPPKEKIPVSVPLAPSPSLPNSESTSDHLVASKVGSIDKPSSSIPKSQKKKKKAVKFADDKIENRKIAIPVKPSSRRPKVLYPVPVEDNHLVADQPTLNTEQVPIDHPLTFNDGSKEKILAMPDTIEDPKLLSQEPLSPPPILTPSEISPSDPSSIAEKNIIEETNPIIDAPVTLSSSQMENPIPVQDEIIPSNAASSQLANAVDSASTQAEIPNSAVPLNQAPSPSSSQAQVAPVTIDAQEQQSVSPSSSSQAMDEPLTKPHIEDPVVTSGIQPSASASAEMPVDNGLTGLFHPSEASSQVIDEVPLTLTKPQSSEDPVLTNDILSSSSAASVEIPVDNSLTGLLPPSNEATSQTIDEVPLTLTNPQSFEDHVVANEIHPSTSASAEIPIGNSLTGLLPPSNESPATSIDEAPLTLTNPQPSEGLVLPNEIKPSTSASVEMPADNALTGLLPPSNELPTTSSQAIDEAPLTLKNPQSSEDPILTNDTQPTFSQTSSNKPAETEAVNVSGDSTSVPKDVIQPKQRSKTIRNIALLGAGGIATGAALALIKNSIPDNSS